MWRVETNCNAAFLMEWALCFPPQDGVFHGKEAMHQLPMQRIPDWGHYTFHFKLKKKNTKETTILFAECRWLLQGWIIDWRSNIESREAAPAQIAII